MDDKTPSLERDKGRSLHVEPSADGIVILRFDVPGEPVNTLRSSFAEEFNRTLDHLEQDRSLRAIVLTSGKPSGFIAGADIGMLKACRSERDAAEISRSAQRALDRIATFRVPTVAAIHGPALGGGLEVALACTARVASEDPKTKLGLPEVQLGVLPAAGGTQRLARMIPIRAALDMMLTGKQVDAKKAKKLGIIDEVVPAAILLDVARKKAGELAEAYVAPSSPEPRRKKKLGRAEVAVEAALTGTPLGRKVLFERAKKALVAKTSGNYPAPERILEVVKKGLERGFEVGLASESAAFGELVMSPQANQLMEIFFASNALKKDNGTSDSNVVAGDLETIGVVGAGLMGGGIAFVTASKAHLSVRLGDKDADGVARGLGHVKSLVDQRLRRRRIDKREAESELHRVSGGIGARHFSGCQVVIEAVFEDLALKQRVLTEIEREAETKVIFATNTSSIPVTKIAEASAHPETVIGMHYFSPVEKMPLLEIVVTPRTSPDVTATCVELGKKQGKTVIVVNDGVGFYTSRILAPMLNEAAFVLSEGVRVEDIDEAMVEFGFPVGPITLLDEVGIDVAGKVGAIVHSHFGDRMRPPAGFETLLADGRQGRKNRRGFYLYEKGKKGTKRVDRSVYATLGIEPGKHIPRDEIAQRCVLAFVNEACLCFGDGVLRSARDGDIGAVFGLGFPPFRGGPFRYVDTVGAREIVRRLERFRDQLGSRFSPAPVLLEMARNGGTFYGDNKVTPGTHKSLAGPVEASARSGELSS